MKSLLLCLLCVIVVNLYARDDSFMYRNIEFYEKKSFLKDSNTANSNMGEKYSIFDSGWVERYGINKEIKVIYLRAYTMNSSLSQKQNLQKVIPRYIKNIYPHEINYITLFEPINQPYIYQMVKGFLYITKKPCGIHSFAINCSNVDYGVAFYITHDDEMQGGDADKGFLTLHINNGMNHILPIEYNKIEAIYPNIKEWLQDKSYLILPIKIQIRTATRIDKPISMQIITISKALATTHKEDEEIAKERKNICAEYKAQYQPKYCSDNPSDDRIYTYSKDMYVNVREKPNNESHIIKQIAIQYPNAKLADSMYWEYDKLEDKYIPSESWINQRQIYLDNNTQVKFIEKLYTKGLPINGWYQDIFYRKNRQEGRRIYPQISTFLGILNEFSCSKSRR
ncbi:hypothetical protein CQA53_09875 [Helicobacter didelphidarum]|uniref:Uncharacterized protein n=1 Tax=Helicobacter didelphidarum TaxID=2040648 RepID=A0A3D8I8Z1_9HELI|nr:hypothetical protein [Helicobacter didelphidarum]RDU61622.1 hypothetical protein CQA53_09875 [Helicobacter didelphidarum]